MGNPIHTENKEHMHSDHIRLDQADYIATVDVPVEKQEEARYAQMVYLMNEAIKISGVTLEAQDLQIGAVELKDNATDLRANITVDDTKNALFVQSESLAKEATLSEVKTNTDKLKFDGEDLKVKGAVTTDVETGLAKESGGNLDAILAKLSADPATQTTLALVVSALNLIKDTDGIKKITDTVNVNIESSDVSQTPDAIAATKIVQQGGIARSGVPTEVTNGDAVATWLDTFGRMIIAGYNPSLNSLDVNVINQALLNTSEGIDLNAVTADGASSAIDYSSFNKITFHIISSGVSDGATVKIQHSLDETNYVDVESADIVANGVVEKTFSNVKYKYLRATVASRVDGTYTVRHIAGM